MRDNIGYMVACCDGERLFCVQKDFSPSVMAMPCHLPHQKEASNANRYVFGELPIRTTKIKNNPRSPHFPFLLLVFFPPSLHTMGLKG